MALNYLEMGQLGAIFASILALFALIVYLEVKRWLPKKERELLSKGEIWMGGAIGRFMQNLSEQATEEEGGSSSGTLPGALELGGFKVNVATIKELLAVLPQIMEAIKMIQSLGFLKGGGGGGAHPFSP